MRNFAWACALGLASLACDGGSDHHHHHDDAGPFPASCQAIVDACHDKDPGSGPLHECHDAGHDGVAATCDAMQATCVAQCQAAPDA